MSLHKGKRALDTHGTPYRRAPGPGPKDAQEGAIGREAEERAEGTPEHAAEEEERAEEAREAGRDGHAVTKNPRR